MFYVFVFLGGFTALVYQVIWQRLAAFSLGSDAGAASVVAAAFMTGLGTGSLAGAIFSKRLSKSHCLISLFFLEICIALSGLASLPVLYEHFYLRLSGQLSFQFLACLVFVVLTLPVFLMGASFPLLTRVAVTEQEGAASSVAKLYAVNTFGAALGALLGGLVLMRQFGIEIAAVITASVNVAAGFLVLGKLAKESKESKESKEFKASKMARNLPAGQNLPAAEIAHQPDATTRANQPFVPWCLLYCLSGFVNLGLELIWFRLLGIMLKANTFSFSWLLFFYLGGLAAGSFCASAWARKFEGKSGQVFLLLQSALTAYTVIFQIVLHREARSGAGLDWLHEYFGTYHPPDLSTFDFSLLWGEQGELFRALYLGLAFFMIFPPTFMMGIGFYCLQRTVQNDLNLVSRKVGLLQMCNITGGTIALLLLGLWGFKYLGTFNALLAICAINLLFLPAYFYVEYCKERTVQAKNRCLVRCTALMTFGILPCLAMPSSQAMWSVLHGHKPYFTYEEDHTGITAVQTAYDDRYFVFVNGEGHSEIPFGDYHSQVGLVPLFLHSEPKDIAIIGLGSGDTCFSATSHKSTRSITCIEIIEGELRVLKRHADKTNYEPLKLLFSDPRVKFVTGDGRRYIESSGRKFDIIQADAIRPFTSQAGKLYSQEYFEAMKGSLKAGGLLVTWLPTRRTYDTFRAVFPYHLYFGNTAIGSNEPIHADTAAALERYREFCLHERVRITGLDGMELVSQFLSWLIPNDTSQIRPDNFNKDLFPRDEFLLPQPKKG